MTDKRRTVQDLTDDELRKFIVSCGIEAMRRGVFPHDPPASREATIEALAQAPDVSLKRVIDDAARTVEVAELATEELERRAAAEEAHSNEPPGAT